MEKSYFEKKSTFEKNILDSYKKGEISTKPIGLNGEETRPLLL